MNLKELYSLSARLIICGFLLIAFEPFAFAQTGASCDAATKMGSCTATATIDGKTIILRPSTKQCAIVTWTADGFRNVTPVIDGEERIDVIMNAPKALAVESCVRIRDLRESGASIGGELGSAIKPSSGSPWEGTWVGDDTNVYGGKHGTVLKMAVKDAAVTGTIVLSGPGASGDAVPVSGLVSGDAIKLKLHCGSCATYKLKLIDNTTLKYSWLFGGGTLRRE